MARKKNQEVWNCMTVRQQGQTADEAEAPVAGSTEAPQVGRDPDQLKHGGMPLA